MAAALGNGDDGTKPRRSDTAAPEELDRHVHNPQPTALSPWLQSAEGSSELCGCPGSPISNNDADQVAVRGPRFVDPVPPQMQWDGASLPFPMGTADLGGSADEFLFRFSLAWAAER